MWRNLWRNMWRNKAMVYLSSRAVIDKVLEKLSPAEKSEIESVQKERLALVTDVAGENCL